MCVHVCVSMCVIKREKERIYRSVCMCGGLWWSEKVVGSLGAKVAGICKLLNMDAGISTLVYTMEHQALDY